MSINCFRASEIHSKRCSRMFSEEISKARDYNVKLSFGIAIFQGLSNLFINGIVLGVLYAGKPNKLGMEQP